MHKLTIETQFPTFPNGIIQGVARDFVELYSPIRETPESFLWLSFVTYLGNAISPYVRLDSDSSEPRLYGVVIGKSGRTRKSAGNNAARDFFKKVRARDQRIIEGFGSAEGMLRSLGADETRRPTILHLDEMNVLASKTDINGSAGIAPLHKLFEDHDYDHPLAQGGYTVRNSYLSLVGASTLEDFRQAWTSKHADAGFFSRLLVVAGDAVKRIPRPIEPDAAKLTQLIADVKTLVSSVITAPVVLKMDSDAEPIWAEFYESFGDGSEWNRIDTYGCRLLGLQAVMRNEASVTKKNVQQVVEFLQYEVAVREAVSPVIAENPVAQMEQLIRKFLPDGQTATRRDLQRRTNYSRLGIQIFNRAVDNMIENEEISYGRNGRSILYTRIRPDETDAGVRSDIGTVFDSNEDRAILRNLNEGKGFEDGSRNCLQDFAHDAPETIM